MRNTTKLLLIIVIIISNIVAMSIPTVQGPFSLKSCSMTSDEILSVMKTTVNDKASLETFIRSKIKADGEIDSKIVMFPSTKDTDRFIFKGSFTSGSQADSLLVAIFSDDGVTVKVNNSTSTLVNMYEKGQALPDVANSLKVVSGNWQNSTTYDLEIQYSNISHPNGADIDGITVFFLGNVTIVPPVAAEPVPVSTSLTFTDGKDKFPYTGNTRTVKATVGLVVNGSGIDPLWGTKEWTVNVVNSADPTVPLATRTFTYLEDKLSYSDDNVDIVLPVAEGRYELKTMITADKFLTEVQLRVLDAKLKVDIYTLDIITVPAICAGGKNDDLHIGTMTARATAGGVGIPDVSFEFALGETLSTLDDTFSPYLPSIITPKVKTDIDGYANTKLKSGTAVLPSIPNKILSKSEVILKEDGVAIPNKNKTLDITAPDMNINIYYTGTTETVEDLYLFGDGVDLIGSIIFNRIKITNHNVTWCFRIFDHDPGNSPLDDQNYLYDGSGDSPQDTEYPGFTLYGSIRTIPVDPVNPSYVAYYETGTKPGWVFWYIDDKDVQKEN